MDIIFGIWDFKCSFILSLILIFSSWSNLELLLATICSLKKEFERLSDTSLEYEIILIRTKPNK